MTATAAYQEAFDYARTDQELVWKRENRVLYAMYLEQRCNARLFQRRALRGGGGGESAPRPA